jgi:hypothetical protein
MAGSASDPSGNPTPDPPAWPHLAIEADPTDHDPDLPSPTPSWLRAAGYDAAAAELADDSASTGAHAAPVEADPPPAPQQRDAGGLALAVRPPLSRVQPPPARRHTRHTRRPGAGLPGLLLFTLLAAFFGWVSAEPFWLAVHHSDDGTATVTRCTGQHLSRHCTGTFTSADGRYRRLALPVVGNLPPTGDAVPAQMTSHRGERAYVGDAVQPRAAVGLGLLLLCGLGIAWSTGATRLPTARNRLLAVLASLAGPLLLFTGMLAITY